MLAPVANGYTTLGRIRSRTVVGAFTRHELPRTQRVVALALKHRLPAVYWLRGYPQAGGLMSYGADLIEVHRRSAFYVNRLLRGARPADLPVEEPTKLALVLNVKTARAIGLTFPPSTLARADEVIQ
jgi:putative ABC transport system substrate-binding protein